MKAEKSNLTKKAALRVWLSSPLFLPHIFLYLISPSKWLIDSDIVAWGKYRDFVGVPGVTSLLRLLVIQREFRSQFALRLGGLSKLLIFLNGGGCSDFGNCRQIGPGFALVHGFGTVINGSAVIGSNCTILHNVTIGGGHGGSPVIGDNVYIGAGAIIIGCVHVGNNVKIGAGAIVVDDVPDNCTVVCEKARILKHNV